MLNDIKLSVEKFDEFINNKTVEELQVFNVRDKVVAMVYSDAIKLIEREKGKENRKTFIKEYEDIYKNSEDSILKTAFGKKWAGIYHYDYDASYCANYVYWKINFSSEEFPIIHMNCGKGNYPYLYIICDSKKMKYRGDTMNTWSTTLNEFMRRYGGEYFNNLEKNRKGKWIYKRKGTDSYKSWEEFLSEPPNYNYNTPLPEYIMEFLDVVYTIGNFIPVPQEPVNFNTQRSVFTKDYWDLTLLAIYEYYMGKSEYTSLSGWILKKEPIKDWFGKFGNGQEGWNNFVEENFIQPFVQEMGNNEYGRPYELWDGHFSQEIMPKEEWQFEQFFVNAKARILKRGWLIAEKMVENISEK